MSSQVALNETAPHQLIMAKGSSKHRPKKASAQLSFNK